MNHPGDLLSAYLDGEVSASERAGIDEHLAVCPPCRGELEDLAGARAAVRSLPMLEPPAGILPEPAEPVVRRLFGRRLAWAAAAVMAGVLGVGLLTGGSSAPPLDLDTLGDQHTARLVVDPGIATIRAPAEAP